MILIAAIRARELKRGDARKVAKENKPIVTALREIEEGKIGKEYLRKVKKRQTKKTIFYIINKGDSRTPICDVFINWSYYA